MPIRIECSCGKVLNVPDTMAGQKGKCPGCGAVLSVPHPGGETKVEEESPRWKYRGPNVSVVPLIMGAVVFVLLVAGGITYYVKKSGSTDTLYEDAMRRIQQRDFFGAIEMLNKIVEKDPKHADAHIALGIIALDQGDYKEAKARFSKALEAKPDYPKGLYHMGVLYLHRDNLKKAKEFHKKLKGLDEKLAQLLLDDIKQRTDSTFGFEIDPSAPKKDPNDVGPKSETEP